jgi:hypothetical protein
MNHAQIRLSRHNRLPDRAGRNRFAERYLDTRVVSAKPGQCRRQQILTGRRQRVQRQPPALQTHDPANRPQGIPLLGENTFRVLFQRLPRVRQADTAPVTRKQRRPDLSLQVGDLQRERRLRDMRRLRGPREVPRCRRRHEITKLKQFHK